MALALHGALGFAPAALSRKQRLRPARVNRARVLAMATPKHQPGKQSSAGEALDNFFQVGNLPTFIPRLSSVLHVPSEQTTYYWCSFNAPTLVCAEVLVRPGVCWCGRSGVHKLLRGARSGPVDCSVNYSGGYRDCSGTFKDCSPAHHCSAAGALYTLFNKVVQDMLPLAGRERAAV